ncbi:MAG TPA: F0F1 ATP synthase subunit gamma [Thermohalobaculum sp.]|nr:F0F1 ATP synthase subunit gamma [Thermohalobaculum sp.]
MPSLKDLRNRINSVRSTRKITSAMKMVAAAKLRRTQDAAHNARPYSERMEEVLSNLARSAKDSPKAPPLLAGTGSDETHLLVVATAERGLCGAFNSSIVKLAKLKAQALLQDGKTVKILTVGRKGREQLRREYGGQLVGHIDLSDARRIGFEHAQKVADDILERFEEGEFDVAHLFFSTFKTVLTQEPTEHRLVPAAVGEEDEEEKGAGTNYEYEPDEDEILAELLPRNLAVQVFRALLENAASEQGARMTAMDNATRNAGDMIERLTIQYNRTRQATITKELIEIISGAEAL